MCPNMWLTVPSVYLIVRLIVLHSLVGGTPDNLVRSVKEVRRSVRQIRSEFQLLRSQHSRQLQTFEHFMKYSCGQIMSRIRRAVINTCKSLLLL